MNLNTQTVPSSHTNNDAILLIPADTFTAPYFRHAHHVVLCAITFIIITAFMIMIIIIHTVIAFHNAPTLFYTHARPMQHAMNTKSWLA